jgi:transketolase
MNKAVSPADALSKEIKSICLKLSHSKQTAHLASALSAADIIACLFANHINVDGFLEKRSALDRFVLSKGHSASALYAALFQVGLITEEQLWSYADSGSIFEEHPNHKIPMVDFPTGSLGHGLPLACGMALGNKIKKYESYTYVLMSDGECNEGAVWESAIFARAKNLGRLIALVDHNKFQATGPTTESFGSISIASAFRGFEWHVQEVDGANHEQLNQALNTAKINDSPSVIVCHTKKGAGISFMEGDNNWHYKAPTSEELNLALGELNA